MKYYSSEKGKGIAFVMLLMISLNVIMCILFKVSRSYILTNVLIVFLVSFNLYGLYYLGQLVSLKYKLDNDGVTILSFFGMRKVFVSWNDIKSYEIKEGSIKGVRLSGIGNSNFAIGRSIIDKIGPTRMFVTANNNVLYLCTDTINYGISPRNFEEFKKYLNEKNISTLNYTKKKLKKVALYKQKKFLILFIIISIIIITMMLTPLILYIQNRLPLTMPLSFDERFKPIALGSDKQFVFKQMIYGALNMIVFVCMYYATCFHAKYDESSAYIYLYVSLILSSIFLFLQMKILSIY